VKLAAYLTGIEPSIKVYSWVEPGKDSSFLNSLCENGFAIEVGAIASGILNAALFQVTESLIQAILDYLENLNSGAIEQTNRKLTIYEHWKPVALDD
jgi:aspartoacylase